jgi:predicted transcriptional regulator
LPCTNVLILTSSAFNAIISVVRATSFCSKAVALAAIVAALASILVLSVATSAPILVLIPTISYYRIL